MSILCMVYGQSGTGKSTSLRNFSPDEVAVINVSGKPMPFRTKLQTYNTDDYNKILNALSKTERKSIVIDDATYLMVGEFMRNAKVAGYQKYTDMAVSFNNLIEFASNFCPIFKINREMYFNKIFACYVPFYSAFKICHYSTLQYSRIAVSTALRSLSIKSCSNNPIGLLTVSCPLL